jgi:hypothetical protein
MQSEHDLLISNVLNEILRGVARSKRVNELLSRRSEIERFEKVWSQSPSMKLAVQHRDLVEECIKAVVNELGGDEFQTRVGVDCEDAEDFLRQLSGTLPAVN